MAHPFFDVAVIGGGPAGMMAAGRAAESGARVILLEKNASLGRKLLLTGNGRCNILHAEDDVQRLVSHYGKKGKALFSAFSQFDAAATRDFFESRGLKIKVEEEQRAFPVSDSAEDVRRTMLRYLEEGNVDVRTSANVLDVEAKNGLITKIILREGDVAARAFILATGGTAHPETGSTGDGFPWLRKLGHTITQPSPALAPIILCESWIRDVAGITLKNVQLTAFRDGAKHDARRGDILFTREGISGPMVLSMSGGIGALLKEGEVSLSLDLFPSFDPNALDQFLLEQFEQGKRRMIRNALSAIVPPRFGMIILSLAGIPSETPLSVLTREQRIAFAFLLKAVPMTVTGLFAEKAITSSGGVDLREVDFRTMQSKRIPNLFFAGDILDFDRPSGGFSLQLCWTTGFVAGTNAVLSFPVIRALPYA